MKILIILGNPDKDSFCGALADTYAKGAKSTGAEVKRLNIGELKFDPILHHGYKKIQKLEPDLKRSQQLIKWADHLVFVYPTWWSAMPALMKGWIDRIFLPGFAFHFKGKSWDKLLKGKSAHLIVTMGAPPIFYKMFFRAPGHHMMKLGVLGFCGIKPVRITNIGPVENPSDKKKQSWLSMVEKKGRKFR